MNIAIEHDWAAWEQWNAVHGNVFQSKSFAEAVKQAGMGVELVIARENEKIVGGCFAFITLPKPVLRYFSEYRIVNGPVLLNYDEQHIVPFLKFLERRAKDCETMVMQIKLSQPFFLDVLEENGYSVAQRAPDYSFHIDLTKDEVQLWNEVDKKTRTAIRKSKKSGVVVRQLNDTKELLMAYSLYIQRARAKKNWIPYPYSFFLGIMEKMHPQNATVLVAEYQGKLIAEALFLHDTKTIFYFNNGSLPEYWNLCANSLLLWEGMLFGKQNGCRLMDLYGTTDGMNKEDPNYNLYVFKSGFGGTLIQTNTFASKFLAPIRKKLWDKIIVPLALPLYKKFSGGLDE